MAEENFLDDVKRTNIERLISHLNGVGASIVNRYPAAEIQSWPIQRNEAQAVIAAGNSATVAMAPFLAQVCEAHYGPATPTVRLAQIKVKAGEVHANATLWEALSAYVNGLRARAQDAIEAATTEAAAHIALREAFTELGAWQTEHGL